MDPFEIFVLALAVALLFLLREYISEQMIESQRLEPYTDYSHCTPAMFSINGCGIRLYTVAREYSTPTATTYSAYLCVSLFYIPILPLKCYRAADCDDNKYIIHGTEQWQVTEVLYLFTTYYRWIAALALALYVAVSFISRSEPL